MTALATAIADFPRSIAENVTVDAKVELARLQFLLERQSSCLMRVGTDGVLLAVNEAGLSLLGGTDLSAVLGTTLPERIVPEQQSSWNEFSVRVWRDGSGSHECDIVGPSGSSRPVMLQGVALLGHPDGIPSMLLTLRDVSATRRLEAAVQEHTIVLQTADRLRSDLEHAVVEQRRLTARLAEKEVEVQQVLLAHTAERKALVGLQATLDQADADRGAVAQALADAQVEHQRVQALLAEREVEVQQVLLAHTAAREAVVGLQAALGHAEVKEQENHAARAALRAEVEQSAVARRQLENRLAGTVKAYEQFTAAQRQRETNLQQLLAESVTAHSDAERALTEAGTENTRLARTVADQTVDLKRLDQNVRELESLAGAGRLAADLARELQSVTAVIEAGARALLENGPVEGPERDQIETIRGGALRVASLARQMATSERPA